MHHTKSLPNLWSQRNLQLEQVPFSWFDSQAPRLDWYVECAASAECLSDVYPGCRGGYIPRAGIFSFPFRSACKFLGVVYRLRPNQCNRAFGAQASGSTCRINVDSGTLPRVDQTRCIDSVSDYMDRLLSLFGGRLDCQCSVGTSNDREN